MGTGMTFIEAIGLGIGMGLAGGVTLSSVLILAEVKRQQMSEQHKKLAMEGLDAFQEKLRVVAAEAGVVEGLVNSQTPRGMS